jgi:hypothetical protein
MEDGQWQMANGRWQRAVFGAHWEMRHPIHLGLAVLLLVASSLISAAAPRHTGIQGQAFLTISHGFGTEVAPGVWVAPPSVTLPVVTSFTVFSARTDRQVARVTTDQNGHYQLSLHPGNYLLMPDDITMIGGCSVSLEPIEITVLPRELTPINLYYFRQGGCPIQADP